MSETKMTAAEFTTAALAKHAILGTGRSPWGTHVREVSTFDADGKYTGSYRPEFASDEDVARLTVTYTEACAALAPCRPPSWCDHGTIRVMSDVWESCSGCFGCRATCEPVPAPVGDYYRHRDNYAGAAWSFSVFVWRAANLETHAALDRSLAGFRCLATVGAAFAGLAALANTVSGFVAAVWSGWNEAAVGRCFMVTGKRGKAKEAYGLVGVCKWMGVRGGRHFSGYRGGYSVGGTNSVGLAVPGRDKLVYVSEKSVTRVYDLPEVVERKARPVVTVDRDTPVVVIDGKSAGKVGVVFWVGSDRDGNPKYGIDCNPDRPEKWKKGYRAPDEFVVWASGSDITTVGSVEHLEFEAKTEYAKREVAGSIDAYTCGPKEK